MRISVAILIAAVLIALVSILIVRTCVQSNHSSNLSPKSPDSGDVSQNELAGSDLVDRALEREVGSSPSTHSVQDTRISDPAPEIMYELKEMLAYSIELAKLAKGKSDLDQFVSRTKFQSHFQVWNESLNQSRIHEIDDSLERYQYIEREFAPLAKSFFRDALDSISDEDGFARDAAHVFFRLASEPFASRTMVSLFHGFVVDHVTDVTDFDVFEKINLAGFSESVKIGSLDAERFDYASELFSFKFSLVNDVLARIGQSNQFIEQFANYDSVLPVMYPFAQWLEERKPLPKGAFLERLRILFIDLSNTRRPQFVIRSAARRTLVLELRRTLERVAKLPDLLEIAVRAINSNSPVTFVEFARSYSRRVRREFDSMAEIEQFFEKAMLSMTDNQVEKYAVQCGTMLADWGWDKIQSMDDHERRSLFETYSERAIREQSFRRYYWAVAALLLFYASPVSSEYEPFDLVVSFMERFMAQESRGADDFSPHRTLGNQFANTIVRCDPERATPMLQSLFVGNGWCVHFPGFGNGVTSALVLVATTKAMLRSAVSVDDLVELYRAIIGYSYHHVMTYQRFRHMIGIAERFKSIPLLNELEAVIVSTWSGQIEINLIRSINAARDRLFDAADSE